MLKINALIYKTLGEQNKLTEKVMSRQKHSAMIAFAALKTATLCSANDCSLGINFYFCGGEIKTEKTVILR